MDAHPTRRGVLAGLTVAALGAVLPTAGTALAQGTTHGSDVTGRLRALEREHSARLGVFARHMVTGQEVAYRAGERFPMCSVFKGVAAAAVLRDLNHDGRFLTRRIRYTGRDIEGQYAPVTGMAEHLERGMTVGELCAATVSHSDGTAGNLLLRELGGPRALTRFCRSLEDSTTRLDRWEPELNSAEPWRTEDTTSPRAIALTYGRLLLGSALSRRDRRRLTGWLLESTTSQERFRAGLPEGWTAADKTGSGDYGTANDAGVVWTPDGAPIALAVLTTKRDAAADTPWDNPLIAETTRMLATALT